MQLKIASWNIHELVPTVRNDRCRWAFDSESPDIVMLQELSELDVYHWPLEYVETCMVEPSVGRPGRSMGLAIASRFPLRGVTSLLFENPGWRNEGYEPPLTAHPKGALIAEVMHPSGTLKVACLHMLPMRLFGVEEDSNEGIAYVQNCLGTLADCGGTFDVVAGDFNSELKQVMALTLGMAGSVGKRPTRNSGQSHDDIFLNQKLRLRSVEILPTDSDHHAVIVDVSLAGKSKDDRRS
jgi:endonuclease/exonuclease/phosphatase family metal-dependent hydrolase